MVVADILHTEHNFRLNIDRIGGRAATLNLVRFFNGGM